jgi:hypothetical protein
MVNTAVNYKGVIVADTLVDKGVFETVIEAVTSIYKLTFQFSNNEGEICAYYENSSKEIFHRSHNYGPFVGKGKTFDEAYRSLEQTMEGVPLTYSQFDLKCLNREYNGYIFNRK